MARSLETTSSRREELKSMLKGRLNLVCIRVLNIDLSSEFYSKAFCLKVKGRWDGLTIDEGDNAKSVPRIGAMKEDEAGEVMELILNQKTAGRRANQLPINHSAIRVTDLEKGFKQAMEAGAISIMPRTAVSIKISKLKAAYVIWAGGACIEIINYFDQ